VLLIGDILRRTAERFPYKPGVVQGETRLSWRQVNELANRVANAFLNIGLQKGDRIALLLNNSHEYVALYFGLAKSGLISVPLNWRLTVEEVAKLVNFVEAKAMVVEERFWTRLCDVRNRLRSVERYILLAQKPESGVENYHLLCSASSAEEPTVAISEFDPYIIFFTSGVTGAPKGVVLTHRHHWLASLAICATMQHTEKTVALVWAPFFHVGGLIGGVLSLTRAGSTLVLLSKFDPVVIMETIQKEKITYTFVVPTVLEQLMNMPNFRNYDISSLQQMLCTAAPLSPTTLRRAVKYFTGVRFYQTYGMTECNLITVLPPEEVVMKHHTVGSMALDIDLRVVNDKGDKLPANQVGEIVIRSDRMFTEYYRQPELCAQAIKNGWFYTGDTGCLDNDGFLSIVDRKKDVIISGGENIYSKEVEDMLYAHPAVAEVAVVGIPDPVWGESVHAVVALRKDHTATEAELIEHCKQRLASYKKPRSIEFLPSLPKISAEKIDKKKLREKWLATAK